MADIRYMVDTDWGKRPLLIDNRRHFGRLRGLTVVSV